MTVEPRSDEKTLAAVVHGAIIVPTYGLVVTLIVWATQKDKSWYVHVNALQAAAWQIATVVVQMLLGMVMALVMFGGMGSAMATSAPGGPPPTQFFVVMLLGYGSFFCGWGVMILFGLYGCYQAATGRLYHYPLIGEYAARLAERMGPAGPPPAPPPLDLGAGADARQTHSSAGNGRPTG
ncbi:MAG: DUF4870 domain-containing protein [Armatimonadota bacterium]